MRKKATQPTISEFYCVICGNKGVPIARYNQREAGHIKDLYCVHCQKETHHVEVRANSPYYRYEEFLYEFENGNFDENGERITPSWRKFISEREQQLEAMKKKSKEGNGK
jgi:hypothetical protein